MTEHKAQQSILSRISAQTTVRTAFMSICYQVHVHYLLHSTTYVTTAICIQLNTSAALRALPHSTTSPWRHPTAVTSSDHRFLVMSMFISSSPLYFLLIVRSMCKSGDFEAFCLLLCDVTSHISFNDTVVPQAKRTVS